jgi:hypothetical protein
MKQDLTTTIVISFVLEIMFVFPIAHNLARTWITANSRSRKLAGHAGIEKGPGVEFRPFSWCVLIYLRLNVGEGLRRKYQFPILVDLDVGTSEINVGDLRCPVSARAAGLSRGR